MLPVMPGLSASVVKAAFAAPSTGSRLRYSPAVFIAVRSSNGLAAVDPSRSSLRLRRRTDGQAAQDEEVKHAPAGGSGVGSLLSSGWSGTCSRRASSSAEILAMKACRPNISAVFSS